MTSFRTLRRALFAFGLGASLGSCGGNGIDRQGGSGGGHAAGAMAGGVSGASGAPGGGAGSGGTGGSAIGGTAGTAAGGGAGSGGTAIGGGGGLGAAAGASGSGVSGGGAGGVGGDGQGGASGMGGAPGGSGGRGGAGGAAGSGGVPSLHQKYASLFPIGAAVDANSMTTHASILTKHFNSITAENEMKFDALQPTEGTFTYTTADRLVSFAQSNNMRVRGHALVWHRQNPAWVFTNASRDVLLSRMRTHITSVMRHFQGKVYVWDVVNEAMMNDGQYRTGAETAEDQRSRWYEIIGESYIAEAFRAARAADPNAKLFYNDYYDYIPAKRDGIYDMLKGLLDSGVPVDGVGLQTHINIAASTDTNNQGYHQSVANLEAAIVKYASLGLEVQITEMDVSLYIPGVTYTSDMFYTAATFTDALKTQQAERYRAFFDLFRAHSDVITSVTLWGVADDNTWLSEFSSGRKDFPLLFDTNHEPKPAFWTVVDF
jgi:endo-1,4-beta-xylanase